MNWFSRMLARLTGAERPTTSRVIHTGRTASGIYVDADTALRVATVWACVRYLTQAVAQLPWHAMVKDAKGNAKVADTHGVDWLLNTRPNPEMGSFTFRQTMLGQALMTGNAYAEIERDQRGIPVALWPIRTRRVAVKRDDAGKLVYEVWDETGGGSSIVQAMDIFHVRGFGDGVVGYSVVDYAAQSIGLTQATELFGATYFGEGMNPSGIVTLKSQMSPAGLEELKTQMSRLYKGPKGSRTMFLDAGAEFTKVSAAPDESQFVETRQYQISEICRWFGVPPHKVMDLSRATFSNIEHQAIEVVVDCVTPWVRIFEQEADYKLFGANNRQGLYTKMSLQALMRGDNASRIAFYKGMSELGMTLNQILALEDMNGIGPDGDVPFVSRNVITLENAITAPTPAPGVPAADPIAPDPAPAEPAAPAPKPAAPKAPAKSRKRANGATHTH